MTFEQLWTEVKRVTDKMLMDDDAFIVLTTYEVRLAESRNGLSDDDNRPVLTFKIKPQEKIIELRGYE